MINRKTSLVFLIFTFGFFSCQQLEDTFVGDKGKELGRNVVVVFCDLSKSMDSSAVQVITNKVVEIYDLFPSNTVFHLGAINVSRSAEYLVESETEKAFDSFYKTEDEINEQKRKLNFYKDSIRGLINSRMYKVYETTEVADNSCIVDKVDRAVETFDSYANEHGNNYLYIVSDMIEDCDNSQILSGNISMENDKFYSGVINKVRNEWNPRTSYIELDAKLFVINITSSLISDNSMSSDNVKEVWSEIFRKYDLIPDSSSVKFYSHVPKLK